MLPTVKAAHLSDNDLAHAAKFAGHLLHPALVVESVKNLREVLKLGGRVKLGKAITKASREAAGEPLRLSAIIPHRQAEKALERAREALHQGATA